MRVFVTGASGWIGSAVVSELIAEGHTVLGLARSDASAEAVRRAGAEVLRGEVTDLGVLRAGAADTDGVIHLAYRHDLAFSGQAEVAIAADRAAIETFGDVLAGTDRPLAIASGVAGLAAGRLVDENDVGEPGPGLHGRRANEQTALALASRGVRSMSVRFAPTVHGDGDHGFTAMIVSGDRRGGLAGYSGDGSARWSAVHRDDAARLVRLAVEGAPAGSVLHAVGEEGVSMRSIAEAIGARFDLPVQSVDPERATEMWGFLADLVTVDMPASSALTRERYGWTPTGPTLTGDIESGAYGKS